MTSVSFFFRSGTCSTRPLRFGISLGGGSSNSNSNSSPSNGPANSGSAHDHNHNMQLKSDNNNRESAGGNHPPPPPPPAKGQRPTYLPVPVTIPVHCDYDSDESDGPILYRDDDEENMSEEGKHDSRCCFQQPHHDRNIGKTARLAARIARKDSLALKLAMRPDRQELIERGILHAQTERERHIQREAVGARLTRYNNETISFIFYHWLVQ